MLPVVAMSRAIATESGSFSCFANSSMMRMFAWWGMNAARSPGSRPAASSASRAFFAISHTAQRKTVGPSCRSVGHAWPSRIEPSVFVIRMVSQCEPSEPHTDGLMPGSSEGPPTTAPAPSPSRKLIERSVGSTISESFSTPTTSTCSAMPLRTSASACATP